MAVANLQGLTNPDDIALAWARFLIDDIVEHREAGTRAVNPGVYVFSKSNDVPSLPTLPEVFDPENSDTLNGVVSEDDAYAYLAVLAGLPVPKGEWSGQAAGQASRQMLGIPPEIIEQGDYPWYLMAVFYSPSKQMTFCGAFNGETFHEIKCIHGAYGGALSSLFGSN
jgi:hypothetical protein